MEDKVVAVHSGEGLTQPAGGGLITFEDIFPPLDIDVPGPNGQTMRKVLEERFRKDLKVCVRHISPMIELWDLWKNLYDLDIIEYRYAAIGGESDFPSGLLCEKAIEARDRFKRALSTPHPMTAIDEKASDIDNMDLVHRMERFMDTIIRLDLKLPDLIAGEGLYDFIVDGDLILEVDTMYRLITRKDIKWYSTPEDLEEDDALVLDRSVLADSYAKLQEGTPVVLVVEKESTGTSGLSVSVVDKRNHLVPPGIYRDQDLRLRANRKFLTKSDLLVLSMKSVNWYSREKVNEVLNRREFVLGGLKDTKSDELDDQQPGISLGFNWSNAHDELRDRGDLPYKDVFPVYRIFMKYGYKTSQDLKGLIPKHCVFDWEPDSGVILRARIAPHTEEDFPWFHFKLGYRKRSYYGFGYGALLYEEDVRQSNILNLSLDASARASFPPYLSVHPQHGGMIPFRGGMGAGQMGWVRQTADFKMLEIVNPSEALIGKMYGLSMRNAENRTGVTSYVMGHPESTDPRAPAEKARMLLGQAQISMDSALDDWAREWNKMIPHIQIALRNVILVMGVESHPLIVDGKVPEDLQGSSKVNIQELSKNFVWVSQASAVVINPEVRKMTALRNFTFLVPVIQKLVMAQPEKYAPYMVNLIYYLAEELEIPQMRQLIPPREMLIEQAPAVLEALSEQVEIIRTSGGQLTPPPAEAIPTTTRGA